MTRLNYPPEYKGIINSIRRKAQRNGVQLYFGIGKTVHTDDDDIEGTAGFFYEVKPPILAVATGVDFKKWILTLIHESCHMDQYFDKSISAERRKQWEEGIIDFFSWLEGSKELTRRQISKALDALIDCELDCEKRSIEKIKKWDLPISIERYTRMANTYFFGYHIIAETRKWYNRLYEIKEVWRHFPEKFLPLSEYKKLAPHHKEIFYANINKNEKAGIE